MWISILDRTLARAIVVPTFLAFALLTVVFALFQLSRIADVIGDVLPSFGDFVSLLWAMVPQFLGLTFPLAFVFGVFVAYGDLRASGEYVALRAIGVGLGRALRPALVLGGVAFIAGLALAHEIEPAGKRRIKALVRALAVDIAPLKVRTRVFQQFARGVLFYAYDHSERGELRNVLLVDMRDLDKVQAVFAERASVAAAPSGGAYAGLNLKLRDGSIEELLAFGKPERRATFRFLELPIDMQGDLERRTRFLREFEEWSTPDLATRIETLRAKGANVAALEVGLHRRFAIPFAPILLVLLGVPLALAGGGRRATSVVLSVALAGAYYLLLRTSDSLAGPLPPWLTAWTPNLIVALVAAIVLSRVARR